MSRKNVDGLGGCVKSPSLLRNTVSGHVARRGCVGRCVRHDKKAAEGQCGIGFLEAHLEDLLQHVSSCGSPVFALQHIFLLNFSKLKKTPSSLCVIKEEMQLRVTESWHRDCSRFIQYLNMYQSSPDSGFMFYQPARK